MVRYKRNQVEEAIANALVQAEVEAGSDLRIRLKRLLETDRTLSRKALSASDQPFAFYTDEEPGRGVEVWFSPYEAFALLMGVLLMQHRWTQGTAVRILREARPTLEPEHGRILAKDPEQPFAKAELLRRARPGIPAVSAPAEVFLAIVTEWGRQADPEAPPHALIVCRGEDQLMQFRRERAPPGTSMTVLEVAGPARILAHHLTHTQPRTRGRSRR
jgi:hypothetical protein